MTNLNTVFRLPQRPEYNIFTNNAWHLALHNQQTPHLLFIRRINSMIFLSNRTQVHPGRILKELRPNFIWPRQSNRSASSILEFASLRYILIRDDVSLRQNRDWFHCTLSTSIQNHNCLIYIFPWRRKCTSQSCCLSFQLFWKKPILTNLA